jgi:hypothetical protein
MAEIIAVDVVCNFQNKTNYLRKTNIMNQSKIFLFIIVIVFMSCETKSKIITKPLPFEFGISMAETKNRILPLCDSINERLNEPIQLPTALKSQSQLDCEGFTYAGKKRRVELIFADDALDIIWILTEAEEEILFIEEFKKLYGDPTHIKEDITFFLNDGVAVRNKPHEILFISERLKAPYGEWLNSTE